MRLLLSIGLQALLAAIVGGWTVPAQAQANRQAVIASARDQGPPRFDQPAEAQAFFVLKRAPVGTPTLDQSRYDVARRSAQALPWFSIARDEYLPARGPDAGIAPAAALDSWSFLGPGNVGGRTRALRHRPGTPTTIYTSGVGGGVWRSTDSGATWVPLFDLGPNIAVTSMAIDTATPNRMFIGTGEGFFNADAIRGAGVFSSTDGGLSWAPLRATQTSDFFYVNEVAISPNDAQVLYAATNTGIWRSLDGGATWAVQLANVAGRGCKHAAPHVATPSGQPDRAKTNPNGG